MTSPVATNDLPILIEQIDQRGYALIASPFEPGAIAEFVATLESRLSDSASSVARLQSRGVTYAARNVLERCPEATTIWRQGVLVEFHTGDNCRAGGGAGTNGGVRNRSASCGR